MRKGLILQKVVFCWKWEPPESGSSHFCFFHGCTKTRTFSARWHLSKTRFLFYSGMDGDMQMWKRFMLWRVSHSTSWENGSRLSQAVPIRTFWSVATKTITAENGNRLSQAVPILMFWRASKNTNSKKGKPLESGGSHFHILVRFTEHNLKKMKPLESGTFLFSCFGAFQTTQTPENGNRLSHSAHFHVLASFKNRDWSKWESLVLRCPNVHVRERLKNTIPENGNRVGQAVPIFTFWRVKQKHKLQKMETAWVWRFSFSCSGTLQKIWTQEKRNRVNQAVPIFVFCNVSKNTNCRK